MCFKITAAQREYFRYTGVSAEVERKKFDRLRLASDATDALLREGNNVGTSGDRGAVYQAPAPMWEARHLKLIVVLAVLGLALVGTTFFFALMSLMRNSTPVQMGLERAKANQAVAARIGTPMKPGWFTTGNIAVTDDTGSANLSLSLSGPKGKGRLYVEATRQAGVWRLESLEFVPHGSEEQMNLLDGAGEAPAANR